MMGFSTDLPVDNFSRPVPPVEGELGQEVILQTQVCELPNR